MKKTILTFLFTISFFNFMKKTILISIIFFVASATLKSQYVFPSGGEDGYDWRVGTNQVISWSKYFMDTTKTIDISLWNADSTSFTTIATNIPITDEYYIWTIPSLHPTGDLFKVKIVYSDEFLPQFKYVSNDFFSIKEQNNLIPYPPLTNSNRIFSNGKIDFILFPNPVTDQISIKSDVKFFGIEIYSSNGELVLRKRFSYNNELSLNANSEKLATGSYTIVVRFMGSFTAKQFVIEK